MTTYGRIGNQVYRVSEPWVAHDGQPRFTLTPVGRGLSVSCVRDGEFFRYSDEDNAKIDESLTIAARITNYLGNGGLFNPEMMEHEKVRDLLIDCRGAIEAIPGDIASRLSKNFI